MPISWPVNPLPLSATRCAHCAGQRSWPPRPAWCTSSYPTPRCLVDPLAQRLQGKDNVDILTGMRVREVAGGASVEEIVVERDGQVRRLAVDAAFVELHLHANSGAVGGLLDLTPGQFIPDRRQERDRRPWPVRRGRCDDRRL